MDMTMQRSAAGHAPCHRDSIEAESPLTMPPSSPDPSKSFLMDAVLMGSEEAVADHCRTSYTHNRISIHFLTTCFVDVFSPLVLLFLSGWWKSLLLQPMQKGGVLILSCSTRKI